MEKKEYDDRQFYKVMKGFIIALIVWFIIMMIALQTGEW